MLPAIIDWSATDFPGVALGDKLRDMVGYKSKSPPKLGQIASILSKRLGDEHSSTISMQLSIRINRILQAQDEYFRLSFTESFGKRLLRLLNGQTVGMGWAILRQPGS